MLHTDRVGSRNNLDRTEGKGGNTMTPTVKQLACMVRSEKLSYYLATGPTSKARLQIDEKYFRNYY